jgi:hypothetical protein
VHCSVGLKTDWLKNLGFQRQQLSGWRPMMGSSGAGAKREKRSEPLLKMGALNSSMGMAVGPESASGRRIDPENPNRVTVHTNLAKMLK